MQKSGAEIRKGSAAVYFTVECEWLGRVWRPDIRAKFLRELSNCSPPRRRPVSAPSWRRWRLTGLKYEAAHYHG